MGKQLCTFVYYYSFMISITQKTIQDLEFDVVLNTIAELCNTDLGKTAALTITPFKEKEILLVNLKQTSEYVSSYSNNNALPNHGFENCNTELKMLAIEDSSLELNGFRKINHLTQSTLLYIDFLKKFKEYYPQLYATSTVLDYEKSICQNIDFIIDKFGEVKDNASLDLKHIRIGINGIRGKINQSFGIALSQYNSAGYLDDIRETVVENRRVLAVLAMYKKKGER